MADTDAVEHDADNNRYLLKRGDRQIGMLTYERGARGELNILHTEIDESLQEKGLGSRFVTEVLDEVRATTSERVVATCPFVNRFIAEHPEYQDLTQRD